MKRFVKKALAALLLFAACSACSAFAASAASDVVIVLDPGHGSGETGATRTWKGHTYREEELNLKIARYVKAELETYDGVKVYMTHNSLKGTPLYREPRIQIAKKYKATALVSIHINATANNSQTKYSGSWAYVPSKSKYPNSKKYAKEARALGAAITAQLKTDVGIKNNGWGYDDELGIILFGMQYKIPSMIIEHCYIDNYNDVSKFLSSDAKLKKIGVADATGIANYYKLKKKEEAKPVNKNKTGWTTLNGKRVYYYQGVLLKDGWKQFTGGRYYFFDENGAMQTGLIKYNGSLYITDANGVRQTGLVQVDGNYYLANITTGKLYTGWKTYQKKKYYFSKTTGAAYKGQKAIGGKYYRFADDGSMVTGWFVTSNGYKRYYQPSNGVMLRNTWQKIEGNWYYFSSVGSAWKSCKKKIDGVEYRFNKDGVCTNKE